MAIYCELPKILDLLRFQAEILSSTDNIARLVNDPGTPRECVPMGASLDGSEASLTNHYKIAAEKPSASDPSKNQTNVVTFTPPSRGVTQQFKFEKNLSFKTAKPRKSELHVAKVAMSSRSIEVCVHPGGNGPTFTVHVPIDDTTTVEKVIVAAMKLYASADGSALMVPHSSSQPPLAATPSRDPKGMAAVSGRGGRCTRRGHSAYTLLLLQPPFLLLALFCVLLLRLTIMSTKFPCFCCLDLRKYAVVAASPNGIVYNFAALNHTQLLTRIGGKQTTYALVRDYSYPDDSSARRMSTTDVLARQTLRINLSNNEYLLQPWTPQVKLGQLLVKICLRRGIDARTVQFCIGDLPVNPDATLEEANVTELNLVPREPTESRSRAASGNPVGIWSDARAFQHQTFKVTKLKKKGPFLKAEVRIMGIDRHLITNESLKGEKTKRPHRLIKDITSLGLAGEGKPTHFYITFYDSEKHKEVRYEYEAANAAEAREIVAKIEHIRKCLVKK